MRVYPVKFCPLIPVYVMVSLPMIIVPEDGKSSGKYSLLFRVAVVTPDPNSLAKVVFM